MSSCLIKFVFLVCYIHSNLAISALDLYLHLQNNNSYRHLSEDILFITDKDSTLYFTLNGSLNLQLVAHSVPSFLKNVTETMQELLNSEIPLILLIYLDSIEAVRELLEAYQTHWTYFYQPMKIFIILSKAEDEELREDWLSRITLELFPNSSLIPELNSDLYIVHEAVFQSETGRAITKLILIDEIYRIRYKTFTQPVNIEEDRESLLLELTAKASRRQDFKNVTIRGVVPKKTQRTAGRDLAYKVEWDSRTGKYELIGGFRVEEFLYLRDSLNFDPVAVVGDGYVSLAPNGTLLGIGQDIAEDLADIAIPSNEIVAYRVKLLTFLHPTSDQRLFAFFKQPPPNAVREIYRQTFTGNLWLACYVNWTLFTACAIFLMWIWRKTYAGRKSWGNGGIGVWDYIFWTIAVVLQQGSSRFRKPEPGGMKIVIISGLLTSTTLYAAYCGSLVSILMTPVVPIKSFADLLENKFILYTEKFTLQANALMTSTHGNRSEDPTRNPGIDWGSLDLEADHAIDKIVRTKSTLLAPSILLYSYLTEKNIPIQFTCEHVAAIPVEVYPPKTGMFVKKGSPLKEVLNFRILRMFERGIRQRIETRGKKAASVTCFRPGEGSTYQASMGIKDVFTAIVTLGLGFFLSCVGLLAEKIVSKFNMK